jgi:hypothetical protein
MTKCKSKLTQLTLVQFKWGDWTLEKHLPKKKPPEKSGGFNLEKIATVFL